MGNRESTTARDLRQATRSKWSAPTPWPAQCCNVCGSTTGLRVGGYRGQPYYYCRDHAQIYRKLKARE